MSGVVTTTLGPKAIFIDEHALVEEGYQVADFRCDRIEVDSVQFNHLKIPLLPSLNKLTSSFQREESKMIHNNKSLIIVNLTFFCTG